MPGTEYVDELFVGSFKILAVNGNPDGSVQAPIASIAVDVTSARTYQNTDGATAWTSLGVLTPNQQFALFSNVQRGFWRLGSSLNLTSCVMGSAGSSGVTRTATADAAGAHQLLQTSTTINTVGQVTGGTSANLLFQIAPHAVWRGGLDAAAIADSRVFVGFVDRVNAFDADDPAFARVGLSFLGGVDTNWHAETRDTTGGVTSRVDLGIAPTTDTVLFEVDYVSDASCFLRIRDLTSAILAETELVANLPGPAISLFYRCGIQSRSGGTVQGYRAYYMELEAGR